MTKRPTSIKDIAREAGVSIATVSRVINGKGRYSSETEERVRKVIRELNYVQNSMAKTLKTNRSNLIGIVVPNITNEFFSQIVQHTQLALLKHGFAAFICNTNEDRELEHIQFNVLQSMNVAGLIYISGLLSLPESLMSIPTVCIDRKPIVDTMRNVSFVESDNLQGARLAMEHLVDRGCKRVACLSPEDQFSTHNIRFDAFSKRAAELGQPMDERNHLIVSRVSYQDAFDIMTDFFEKGGKIDGLFATTDWLAIGAIDAMKAKGIRVPGSVRVIGFGDISSASFRDVPLSTVRQYPEKLADASVEILLEQIKTGHTKEEHTVIPVELIQRQTT